MAMKCNMSLMLTLIQMLLKLRAAEAKDYGKIEDICSEARDKIRKRNKCIKLKNPHQGGTQSKGICMMNWLRSPMMKRELDPTRTELCELENSVKKKTRQEKKGNFVKENRSYTSSSFFNCYWP